MYVYQYIYKRDKIQMIFQRNSYFITFLITFASFILKSTDNLINITVFNFHMKNVNKVKRQTFLKTMDMMNTFLSETHFLTNCHPSFESENK